MDELALLCNVYAQGPGTLRVLHRAGIRTLENACAASDWALAELLESTPSEARRFVREARLLLENRDERQLQAEDSASEAWSA